jgi:hypothetical protein
MVHVSQPAAKKLFGLDASLPQVLSQQTHPKEVSKATKRVQVLHPQNRGANPSDVLVRYSFATSVPV